MRIAMYYNNNDIRVEELPKPKISAEEILIKVDACGICGSDVIEWYRIHKAPLVLGHEIAGIIAECGNKVKGFKEGDRVSASHHVPCNKCHYCKTGHQTACQTLYDTKFDPGGFAEFVRLPAINIESGGIYHVDNSISDEEATFTEPLACVLRAQRIAGVDSSKCVLIMGSGISGLLHIKMAKALGANPTIATDISEFRLSKAKEFGADLTLKADENIEKKIKEINNGRLADIAIVCTGAGKANIDALNLVDRGGTISYFAPTDQGFTVNLSINDFFFKKDRTITTSYAGSPEDHVEALKLIKDGKVTVKDMITHRENLDETQKGFGLVAKAQESIKVIIQPQK